MTNEPRRIEGSAGSRTRVLLGNSGSDYLAFYNEDDGTTKWQKLLRTPHGIPGGLEDQLNNMEKKGRIIKSVAFGPDGEWFVTGVKMDGTGQYAWWSGVPDSCSRRLQDWCGCGNVMNVSFGDADRFVFTIEGTNGYHLIEKKLPSALIQTLNRELRKKKTVRFVRLIGDDSYIVSQMNGSLEYYGNGIGSHLEKELKRDTRILDMSVAGDGSWIVMRHNDFSHSRGVCSNLVASVTAFYARHKRRQQQRVNEINVFQANLRRLEEERQAEERRCKERKEAERLAAERRRQEEEVAERGRVALDAETKRQREVSAHLFDIRAKRLKVGDQVTVLGFSLEQGDSFVKGVKATGEVQVERVKGAYHNTMKLIEDPRKITPYDRDQAFNKQEMLLFAATDEYEAAVSVYHCVCDGNVCLCKKIHPAPSHTSTSEFSIQREPDRWQFGDRVHVKGYANATIIERHAFGYSSSLIPVRYDDGSTYHVRQDQLSLPIGEPLGSSYCGIITTSASHFGLQSIVSVNPVLEHRAEVLPFDEYKCAEKIDLKRLKRIIDDLQRDRSEREIQIKILENAGEFARKQGQRGQWLTQLQRCCVLDETAQTLYNFLKDVPVGSDGVVVHEVNYEHRDPTHRGRLFAIGMYVKATEGKYPRTATLQGMHSDLRAPLIGSFAHDIDCENSEVRLLCSLAVQLDLRDLVPILFEYRDNRSVWLREISSVHGVTESDAKRLPNIILSGGRYDSWLKAMNVAAPSQCPMRRKS